MFFILHQSHPILHHHFFPVQKPINPLFQVHAALDTLDQLIKKKRQYYLGFISSEDIPLYAFIGSGGHKLILTLTSNHESEKKIDNAIKQFLIRVNDALVQYLLNPMYKLGTQIKSAQFQQKVKIAAKQWMRIYTEKEGKK